MFEIKIENIREQQLTGKPVEEIKKEVNMAGLKIKFEDDKLTIEM